ncbi:heat-inducible transcriptional repressor HrcA [[Mycoplasma] gypis]|uniref:Heat-inducible transcription repressor HrcA n=1 Tax=[Mycoplasma] gypis TaxID=92404 RepID=A0ABZ2RPW4_9BACT|nr:heat-inducible transcriptional repressor HrcA [[Mycoplasma] gypis]MBN0919039.1 heat-inducible transcriptional repressor HrcA [[Mycoplasma] gypis]
MSNLNPKERDIFKKIVDSYIETGNPVGSKYLCERYHLQCSPATVRNIMSNLEEKEYIEKNHTSSGRIPSSKGLEFYAKFLAYNPEKYFKEKLEDMLAKRRLSIDTTIEQAANVISEVAGLTLVTVSENSDEVLKSIQLTVLGEDSAIIVLVTSSGKVESKVFNYDNEKIQLDDVRIAVRLFKDRLINTPLIELKEKAKALAPLLAEKVKNYEILMQEFIKNILTFESNFKSKIYNKNQIILSRDISREQITEIFEMIENHSVWEALEQDLDEESAIKFDINNDQNVSLISKKIEFQNSDNIKEISIVGPKRMNYEKAIEAMSIVEKLLKKGY